jgi:hypothetical protein
MSGPAVAATGDLWVQAVAALPSPRPTLNGGTLDDAFAAPADFSDLRSRRPPVTRKGSLSSRLAAWTVVIGRRVRAAQPVAPMMGRSDSASETSGGHLTP